MTFYEMQNAIVQAFGLTEEGRGILGVRLTLTPTEWPCAEVSYTELKQCSPGEGGMTLMTEVTTEKRFTYRLGKKSLPAIDGINNRILRAVLGTKKVEQMVLVHKVVITLRYGMIPTVEYCEDLRPDNFSLMDLQAALCPMTKESPHGDANQPSGPESGFGF
jgi:hypothetical protein